MNRVDTNDVFGRLTVIGDAGPDRYGHPRAFCRCECGTLKTVLEWDLVHGKVKSCRCYSRDLTIARKRKACGVNHAQFRNLVGRKFGTLTVTKLIGFHATHRSAIWQTVCDCGGTRQVCYSHLVTGLRRNCGRNCTEKKVA